MDGNDENVDDSEDYGDTSKQLKMISTLKTKMINSH